MKCEVCGRPQLMLQGINGKYLCANCWTEYASIFLNAPQPIAIEDPIVFIDLPYDPREQEW
jgi:hypothetical protein